MNIHSDDRDVVDVANDPAESADLVSAALRQARYNEIVHITICNQVDVDHKSNSNSCEQEKVMIPQQTEKEEAETRTNSISDTTTEGTAYRASPLPLEHEICLIPCLNEQQGGIKFMNLLDLVHDRDCQQPPQLVSLSDQENILQKELQTKRWFFPMLNDHRRNELYYRAIQAATIHAYQHLDRSSKQNHKCPTTTTPTNRTTDDQPLLKVLDIGSGSGLLSMMVAKYCQEATPQLPVHITSVEMSSAFSVLASRTIQENHFTDDMISIQHGQHSTSLTCNQRNPTKFDLCISELLDDGLLGEGWIPSIRDAWERHLNPHAVVIPCGAQVYASVVHAEWLSNYMGPHSYDFTTLDGCNHHVSFNLDSNEGHERLIDAEHIVLPVHAEKLIRDGSITVLSDAIPIFNFDVTCPQSIPGPYGRSKIVPISVRSASRENATAGSDSPTLVGNAHGVLVWWEMKLWGNHDIYTTEPGKGPWQDHWHPCLHVFRRGVNIQGLDTIELEFRHDDYRIFVDLVNAPSCISSSNEEDHRQMKRIKRNNNDAKLIVCKESASPLPLISPVRAYQLNDCKRLNIFQRALETALSLKGQTCSKTAVVLDVSDFALGAIFVAAMVAAKIDYHCKVVSLESSSGQLPMLAARVAQFGNKLISNHRNFQFDILQCYNESISLEVIGGSPVDILFSEPYTEILEGWHLQEALNFYYTVRLLRANGILNNETTVLPSNCRVLGCIIESSQLRSAYGPCGDGYKSESIHGLKHNYINQIGGRFQDYDLSLPMWQYDYTILTNTLELGTLSYTHPYAPPFLAETLATATFHTHGRCDALLVWLEYSFELPSSMISVHDSNILSTNSQSYNQLIRMLDDSTRCSVNIDTIDDAEVICKSAFGGNTWESHQLDVHINLLKQAEGSVNN